MSIRNPFVTAEIQSYYPHRKHWANPNVNDIKQHFIDLIKKDVITLKQLSNTPLIYIMRNYTINASVQKIMDALKELNEANHINSRETKR